MRHLFNILLVLTLIPSALGRDRPKVGFIRAIVDAAYSGDFWVSQHAVEYLLDLGYRDLAEELCEKVLITHENTSQYRVGLWRVQYHLSSNNDQKKEVLKKLIAAYEAVDGSDRIHAAETLAKLNFCFQQVDPALVESDLLRSDMLGAFVEWGVTVPCAHGEEVVLDKLFERLEGSAIERQIAAYALTFLDVPLGTYWQRLAKAALLETNAQVKGYMVSAAYQTVPECGQSAPLFLRVKAELMQLPTSNNKSDRMEFCRAMAKRYVTEAGTHLLDLVNISDPIVELPEGKVDVRDAAVHAWNQDIRATAAYAILKNNLNAINH